MLSSLPGRVEVYKVPPVSKLGPQSTHKMLEPSKNVHKDFAQYKRILTHLEEAINSRSHKEIRISWLTNSALVYEPKCGGGGVSANGTVVHMEPNKLWRANSIFNL
jgi:hypothetical protein